MRKTNNPLANRFWVKPSHFRKLIAGAVSLFFSSQASALTYVYDDAGRLTTAIYENGTAVRYAYDTAGNILSISPLQAPAAPTAITADQTEDGVLISWTDNASNENGYIVQRRAASSDEWIEIANLSSGSTSYLDYTYRVLASGGFDNSAYSESTTVSEDTPRLVNLSSRAEVGAGVNVMIAGFFVGGENTKRVVIRAVGPTLKTLIPTFQGELTDPTLSIRNADQTEIAFNDNWGDQANKDEIQQAFASVGAFGLDQNGKDSATMLDLSPGSYSAIISSKTGQPGIALAEVYDLSNDTSTRLLNLSTRVNVGEGDKVLIGGFVLRGSGKTKLLVRAVGPQLTDFGLSGALADPQVTLFRGSEFIASNDDWNSGNNTAEVIAASNSVGAFSLNSGSKDSVILIEVDPGIYSASISGVNAATGIAIVEIYAVP